MSEVKNEHDTGTGNSSELAVPGGQAAALDTAYEIALDDGPAGGTVPVHDGDGLELPPEPGARLPVIPQHLRTVAGVRSALAARSADAAHGGAYHAVRSPRYLLFAIVWALVGLWRLGWRLLGWWWVAESGTLRSEAVIAGDSREWLKLHQHARNVRRDRGLVLLGCMGAAVLAVSLLARYAPWWGWAVLGVVALPLLARTGRPEDRPIITPSMTTPRFRLLNADVVLRAYYRAGLGSPDKEGEEITFGAPMARDGDGSRVLVDLPYGRTLTEAMDRREKIASGLDVALSQVFIHRDPTSNRRHVLWVADRDPLASPAGSTPLLACKATDIWKPAPLGLDERGQLVRVEMMWHSFLFGGMPRQGKTWSARLLGLYAALDPHVKLHVFDASGKPDWRKFALIADTCAFGLTPTREGRPPEILGETLMSIKNDVEDRYERLSGMPTSVCPQGKLTREIARDPRYNMPVRLLILDEVQEYFLLGKISETIAELLVYLVKVAPGAGVIVLDGTQRPSGIGTGSIQTQFVNFRDQHQVKFALRTASWKVSDLVLGDGAYSAGLDSSTLLPEYKGVGILRGAMDANPTTRCHTADDQDAEKILLAARALRERAGTLSGMAAGEDTGMPARDVLADLLAVFNGDAGLHWAEAAARLAGQFPDRWADASPDSVSAQCRALGVPSVDVKRAGRSAKGCRRADVETASRSR